MSMLETLKARLLASRKAGNAAEMGVLQVILGDASTLQARSGKPPADDEVEKLIRKTLLGNQETMGLMAERGMTGTDNYAKLQTETALLQSLLPQTLSVEAIVAELAAIADAVKAAKNDGQATGVAMKHFKGKGLRVLGEDVTAAVKRLRGG